MDKNKLTPEFAEIIGIIMGDGCLYFDKYKKYQTIIAFNKKEKCYLFYVKKLLEKYFQSYKFCITEIKHEFLLRNTSIFIGAYLISAGLCAGNKVSNKIQVPSWILQDHKFSLAFLRGFFDTDGCVYRKYGKYAQIQFHLASEEIIQSLYQILISLSFNPTQIKKRFYKGRPSWKVYLVRQKEIERFFEEIKPQNLKHVERFRNIISKKCMSQYYKFSPTMRGVEYNKQ